MFHRYWKCKVCNVLTTARFGTVLYKSKLKLKNWIMLAYCFTERNRTYAQTKAEASLPQEGYEDRSLSERTINRWYRFFRSLCRKDFRKNKKQLGGKGLVVEGDESLFRPCNMCSILFTGLGKQSCTKTEVFILYRVDPN